MQQVSFSIPVHLRDRVQRFGKNFAFTCLGHSLSFGRLDQLSDCFALWLREESGLRPGDRVAVQLPNLLQYPVVALGVLKAGMVLVNINPMYTPAELRRLLCDSGARALVVLAGNAGGAASILAGTGVRMLLGTRIGDMHPWHKRWLLNWVARLRRKAIPGGKRSNTVPLLKILRAGEVLRGRRGRGPDIERLSPDSLALLQYTGGTTGAARAAMLSHRNLVSNVEQITRHLADDFPPPGAVVVAPLPLYHIYAFTLGLLNGMAHGHHTLLIPDPRDQRAMVRALKPWRISGFIGIDTLYRQLLDYPPFRALDFSALTISSAGGMGLSSDIAGRWFELTGNRIIEGYGMTECSPLLVCNTYASLREGTVGRAVPWTGIRLVNGDGEEVPPGAAGEICVRGPQVMQGYWNGEAGTAPAVQGWFHTGDVGVLDQDGFLRIVDRLKDIIIVSGFKVYPAEVEAHVRGHPAVRDACVVGVGSESRRRVKLFVVPGSPEPTAAELVAWCRTGLAAYKVPRLVEFRAQLPKSNVGKVLRKVLREEAAG